MNYRDEVLWNQLTDVRGYTLSVVQDLSEDVVDIVPNGFNNSIRWNIGHIVLDQELWFFHLIEDKMFIPEHYRSYFDYGTSPKTWQGEPPSWQELLKHLVEQPQRLKQHFQGRLDEPLIRETESGMGKIGEVIPRTLYHEWMHLAAIQAHLRLIKLQQSK